LAANGDKREALDAGLRLARLLLSVAAGTIVLSATLLQTIYVGRSQHLLEVAWILLAVSLLLGYLGHGQYVTQLDNSNLKTKGRFERLSLFQFLFLFAGLGLFAIFVAINLRAGPRLETTRAELLGGGRLVAVTVDCRSGSDSGCRGEVTLIAARKKPIQIGRGLFAGEADGPQVARVPVSAAERASLTVGKAPTLEVKARATGKFGNQTESTSTLLLRRPQKPAPRAGRPG
jgi:hypothetical protein